MCATFLSVKIIVVIGVPRPFRVRERRGVPLLAICFTACSIDHVTISHMIGTGHVFGSDYRDIE